MYFTDRADAGRKLSRKLNKKIYKKATVFALPRGGVPVGCEVAKHLKAPLDVLVVRKIGSPMQPEYGLGAISESGAVVLDHDRMATAQITEKDIKEIVAMERKELERRVGLYRKGKILSIKNKDVILVDDGLATGVTARAAALAAKNLGAKKITFVAPVCAEQSMVELANYVDEIICLDEPENLGSIGAYYNHFDQVNDEEVVSLLSQSTL